MAIPNPNPNIFDGAPRDNKTYSSAMIEKKISEGGGGSSVVPDPAVADIGKVLGIVSDGNTGAEYEAVSIPRDAVIIEFPDADYPEDIEELPEGVTGEYIYNLVNSGKTVILACGTDDGEGRYLLPVYNVYKQSTHYYVHACLTLPGFSGNPIKLIHVGCYDVLIHNNSISVNYEYFPIPQPPTIREITLTLGAYDTADDYGTVTCNKTMAEIKSYIDAGDVLHIKDTNGYYYSVSEVYGSSRISFLGARYESNTIVMYLISLADGEYTKRELAAS